jgi:hypothetical protein
MNNVITALAALRVTCTVLAAAPANMSGSSCPPGNSGYVLWDVATEPCAADNAADELGNADGWVCATPKRGRPRREWEPFQIYNFIDNRVAAGLSRP